MSAELENLKALACKFQTASLFDKEAKAVALAAGFLTWAEALESAIENHFKKDSAVIDEIFELLKEVQDGKK